MDVAAVLYFVHFSLSHDVSSVESFWRACRRLAFHPLIFSLLYDHEIHDLSQQFHLLLAYVLEGEILVQVNFNVSTQNGVSTRICCEKGFCSGRKLKL